MSYKKKDWRASAFDMTPTVELDSVVFADYIVGAISKEGLAEGAPPILHLI